MTAGLEFTGERFVPGTSGSIAYEHGHRYAFVRRFVGGKRVLDAACGEGYGAAQMSQLARDVCGIDISDEAIAHARVRYSDIANLRFERASVTSLPLDDASVDVIASFETIEHVSAEDQVRMLAEFARVLTPEGVLILSSPNRRRYSDARDYRNPFHLHELYRDELERLLDAHFPVRSFYHQSPLFASSMWNEGNDREYEAWTGDGAVVGPAAIADGLYYVVVAARLAAALPKTGPGLSLFQDHEQTELVRAETAQAEVLRLDSLLRERDATLAQRGQHVAHLEELVAFREGVIQERDAQLAGLNEAVAQRDRELAALRDSGQRLAQANASLESQLHDTEQHLHTSREESRRLEAALTAQERIITYRQSLRWWAQLPWVRAHSWWQRKVRT